MQVCTVINRAWVAHARGLAESLAAHQRDARLTVLVVDSPDGYFDPAEEAFEVLTADELALASFEAMAARYDVTELCCALKPAILMHLLARDASGEPVVYLDSDVRVYGALEGLTSLLAEHPLLLSPHLLQPLPDDGLQPDELAVLLAGSSNLGLIAARHTPGVMSLLEWWQQRLVRGSRLDPERAMVYDQRWADLMPGFSDEIGLVRHPGINYGYWRAATTKLARDGDRLTVDGEPLVSFHFSGFDPERPDRLSRFDNRDIALTGVALELCERFGEQLLANGHEAASRWPYGYDATHSGIPLDRLLRDLWDGAGEGAVGNPFEPTGEQAFLAWLGEPDPSADGPPMSRYLHALYDSNEELRTRFPEVRDGAPERLDAWAREAAERAPDGILARLGSPAKTGAGGLHELEPGGTVAAQRGEAVVCIPVYGARDRLAECLETVLAHTPPGTKIVIADDASPDPAIRELVTALDAAGALSGHELFFMRQTRNLGFPGNVNSVFATAAPADVLVLNSDCAVAAGWFDGMRRAAYSDELVATASALTNHGTILSVPERNRPAPSLAQAMDLRSAAGGVLEQSLRLYPRLPTAIGHCVYIRRQALDLVGDFDLAFSPGYGEEVDFSQRCVLHGLCHVAADDVFVLHHGGASLGEEGAANPIQDEHEAIIAARYPYYQRAQAAAGEDTSGPLARAISSARRAMTGAVTVTIDARCLGPITTGTQIHTLELIEAVARAGRVVMRVIVAPDLGSEAAARLGALQGVDLIPHTDVHPHMPKTEIAHRPYQVSSADDLRLLRYAGERVVVTHQDLIAYRNPGYFPGYRQWHRYRRLTRTALALADLVLFFSHHAAVDATREDLVEPPHQRVVYIGVDHRYAVDGEPIAPAGMRGREQRPYLLCLGTDFRHKNRVFALRLCEALREHEGWDGDLVLAGPRVNDGSSAGEESEFLLRRPALAEHVVRLPAVSEAEKEWLMNGCTAVLYPTTHEGFGLMPFEAAAHDRPCIFAYGTALAEILPEDTATLVPWDVHLSAARVMQLLSSPTARDEQVRKIRTAGSRFSWHDTGEAIVDAYYTAAAAPARDAGRLAAETTEMELELAESDRKYTELWTALSADAHRLVGPDGTLTPDATRALAAMTRRPLLRRLIVGSIGLVGKFARRKTPEGAASPASPQAFALHFEWPNREHMREQLADLSQAPDDQP